MSIDKEVFNARYGSREQAMAIINDAADSQKVKSGTLASYAVKNPALTDDDLFHIIQTHPHPVVTGGASDAIYARGWKRKSILDPSWVRWK